MQRLSASSFKLFSLVIAILAESGNPPGLSDSLWAHHHYLLAMLRYKLRDADLAEDILQETYLAALRSPRPLSDFPTDQSLRNYLVTIALNKLRDHFRRTGGSPQRNLHFHTREALDLWLAELPDPASPHPEAMVQAEAEQERRDLVALVMASLPDRYRDILGLKFIENLANPEIATRLQLGIKAVESLLVRAKATFRKEFEARALAANEPAGLGVDSRKGGRS